jgi:hypothetical protein
MNLLLARVRSEGDIALAAATSGVAALLLAGGTTAHSRFGIPLRHGGTSALVMEGDAAAVIRRARLIAWDEAPMAHRDTFRVLDALLRDVMHSVDPAYEGVPFGGKTVVLSGDWRQVLPVVRRGTRAAIVNACLKRSPLWRHFRVMTLRTNMRVRAVPTPEGRAAVEAFSAWLEAVGNGTLPSPLPIPPHLVVPTTDVRDLLHTIFPSNRPDPVIYTQRCVLTPLNKTVQHINDMAFTDFPGPETVYCSADYFPSDDATNAMIYPTELLNILRPSGMTQHRLVLKPGVPIILLRNLNRMMGLMNGTRLVVEACLRYSVQARVLTGPAAGRSVCLPRINLTVPDSSELSIQFIRRQIPVALAFAMTINKAEGQTFDRVGLWLPDHVFSHGQLYVALSRVSAVDGIAVQVGPRLTPPAGEPLTVENIVWKEVLS